MRKHKYTRGSALRQLAKAMLSPINIVHVDSGLRASGSMSPGYFAEPMMSMNRAFTNQHKRTSPP